MSPAASGLPVAVTGWSVHLPGVDAAAEVGLPGTGPACAADDARLWLGRKGLLFKEPATRLALCAVHRALGLPPAAARTGSAPARAGSGAGRADGGVDPRTAVVASSNLGNVATVVDVVRTVRAEGGRAVSPLAAPNASSNVIASTVALWFGWGGPNLMVCSGATSGLDAIALAGLLLAARRADRVVVVGAEPDDEVASAVHGRRLAYDDGPPLRAAAACVILRRPDDVGGGAATLGPVMVGGAVGPHEDAGPLARLRDLGDTYGAAGVVLVALAAGLLDAGLAAGPVPVACGDPVDGWRHMSVRVGDRR
ncbi:MAG TPA: beta-ketoacyl synthase N-terminal-like domain-containing protein [Pilimelia sp.]|nr:beta-ketoacyl synthase N-terminal-like domain-containing protein [Pilimelia sp.]